MGQFLDFNKNYDNERSRSDNNFVKNLGALDIEKSPLAFIGSSKKMKKHLVKNKIISPTKSFGFKHNFEPEELKYSKS